MPPPSNPWPFSVPFLFFFPHIFGMAGQRMVPVLIVGVFVSCPPPSASFYILCPQVVSRTHSRLLKTLFWLVRGRHFPPITPIYLWPALGPQVRRRFAQLAPSLLLVPLAPFFSILDPCSPEEDGTAPPPPPESFSSALVPPPPLGNCGPPRH